MKKLTQSFYLLFISLLVTVWSCKPGDVGPKGDTGATGATGAAGPIGATGATGTANIIYSDWANVTFTGSGTSWIGKITAPKITQEILDKGMVKAYFKFGSSTYEGNYVNAPINASMYYFIDLGAINIRANFNASYPWRYIIVPGGVGARKAAVDYSDYEAVKKYYNLPD